MPFVTSKDGTRIGYEKMGTGPALILVDGALCYRGGGWTLQAADLLKDQFTVYAYDRRGRGESGNTLPYAPEREYEDLLAVIAAVGGPAFLYGHSSGGVISLEAANRSRDVAKVFVYEPPFMTDETRQADPAYLERMTSLIAIGRHGDAVKHFMLNGVRMPGWVVFILQFLPMFRKLEAIAPTLAHDTAITVPHQQGKPLPPNLWPNVTVPVMVVGGTKSDAWMRNAQRAIAANLPNATHAELAGQNHAVKVAAVAPMLREFFAR